MKRDRLLITAALLGILARPLDEAKAQFLGVQQYVLFLVSVVPMEEIQKPFLDYALYFLDRKLAEELPNVSFDYKETLTRDERKRIKDMGQELLTIQLTADGNARSANVIAECNQHRSQFATRPHENVNVDGLIRNDADLKKIVDIIREHHEKCHVSGRECK